VFRVPIQGFYFSGVWPLIKYYFRNFRKLIYFKTNKDWRFIMKIHEYQAKNLLRAYNVPVPEGDVAETPEQARKVAESLGKTCIVKAQIHAGGRGKGGGVKVAKTPEEAYKNAKAIIGMQLIPIRRARKG
jgi:phosphoribosylaminoimidazole carboxylase (NCAIR synthetase)